LPVAAVRRTIPGVELTVVLEPDPDTDPEDREHLGLQLRNELRALDVDDVAVVGGGPPPDGAKSGAAAPLTEWLVTLSAGGGVFVTVIATIKDWLGRRSAGHTVKLTIDGDTLELDGATQSERDELVATFVRRHQPV
jgi:Effector Associated Constant Component 1